MIPFLDLGAAYKELQVQIDTAVKRVLESGQYILGQEVETFEAEWANYCGANYAVGVANGLDALTLALRSLDVGPGDEVIVPSNTYIATWLAVTAVGAKPVPVEPNLLTNNIEAVQIEGAISKHTRAIIPVHLYGQPVNLDPIISLARKYNLYVIEDAAQSHGAKYKGKRIGSHGDIVCWSFYPGKNLGAMGDAGGITTNNSVLANRIKTLRNYGSEQKYCNTELGVNSRIDPIQAAILRAKLPFLDIWTNRRKAIAHRYLADLQGTNLILPVIPEWADPAWHLFVVRSKNRNELQKKLQDLGISTLIHYPIPPHRQIAYKSLRTTADKYPVAEQLAEEVLSLPIGPHLDISLVETEITPSIRRCL